MPRVLLGLEDFCEDCGLGWWPSAPCVWKVGGGCAPSYAEWKEEQHRKWVVEVKRVLLLLHQKMPSPVMVLVKDFIGV